MQKLLIFILFLILGMLNAQCEDLRFVQITDVRYSEKNKELLEKIIDDVNKQDHIDFVVFTGDNIQKLCIKNLDSFITTAKQLNTPFYVLIGDKDINKNKDLSKKQFAQLLKKRLRNYRHTDLNYTFMHKGVVFFVVDGAKEVIPSTNGYFKNDVIEWVDANLDLYQKNNIVILQHFPLIPPINKENYITYKPERYLGIINNHKNVRAIISGHFGVNKEEIVNNVVHISTAPPPYYRIIDIIDCTSDNPTIWAELKNITP